MKKTAISILSIFVFLIVSYFAVLWWGIRKVKNFCEDMKPGLEVNKIAEIADKHNVCDRLVCDQSRIASDTLGIKMGEQWFFVVIAPMTMGDIGCGVYHNNKVVISAKMGGN